MLGYSYVSCSPRRSSRRFPAVALRSTLLIVVTWVGLAIAGGREDRTVEPAASDAPESRAAPAAPAGMNGTVWCLAEYEGALVAGGSFSNAGAVEANRIAGWDGTAWSPLGDGLDGTVFALCEYEGELIAGGEFTSGGGMPIHRIARWDGNAWHALGAGVDGDVRALVVCGDDLIVGGDFTQAGGIEAAKIAAWDGASWSPMGSGFGGGFEDYGVRALTLFEGDPVAAGFFLYSGTVPTNRIARWNGIQWAPLGNWIDDDAYALLVYQSRLITGTTVWHPGEGSWANMVKYLDGWSWMPMDDGILEAPYPNAVRALASYQGGLYAAGQFTRAGGAPIDHIAQWDGAQWGDIDWAPAGDGANGDVFALSVHDDKLYAGGTFTTAGGAAADRIAFWDGIGWHPAGPVGSPGPVPDGHSYLSVAPNPFASAAQISTAGAGRGSLSLRLYDLGGRLVRSWELPDGIGLEHVIWDGTDHTGTLLGPGSYVCRAEAAGRLFARSVIKID